MSLSSLMARDAGRLLGPKRLGEALQYLAPNGGEPASFRGAISAVENAAEKDGAIGDLLKVTAISLEVAPVRGGFVRRFPGAPGQVDFRVTATRINGPYVEIFLSAHTRGGRP